MRSNEEQDVRGRQRAGGGGYGMQGFGDAEGGGSSLGGWSATKAGRHPYNINIKHALVYVYIYIRNTGCRVNIRYLV